jgi:hypothetical protein
MKIGVGFGFAITIAAALGVLAISNMLKGPTREVV